MRADVAAILRGLGTATASALRATGGNADYERGYIDAIIAVAVALDISVQELRLVNKVQS